MFDTTIAVDAGIGADSETDSLVFLGAVSSVTIANWVQGVDSVDVDDTAGWAITNDNGVNTTLSNGVSDITFIGVTGMLDINDFLI